ncbi:uncharacterized protein BDCG_06223 [Blastomyces dermatitidis ER-3]|uniref:Uncharacterized protein n=2 Tax=Blastomyces TaxID=229219 RepID=A0A179UA51_BLAGS|nr:uncharacterized protein BDBG_00806 [Blastomyces gilchristii SLH14081]XP_045277701.1 uncharacterized protein BDCG_06223 [Blastomyces dermatitidis ER-3]EEQ91103.2 hypothetical protein BDCG_06223 [Blastomyces dermatitidis ER-3]OAT04198.1 hypothetical protein BDBG_00806 [Blastomyces gilchristii SLH14081]
MNQHGLCGYRRESCTWGIKRTAQHGEDGESSFAKDPEEAIQEKTTTKPNIWVLIDHPDESERKPSNSTAASLRKCTMTASALMSPSDDRRLAR